MLKKHKCFTNIVATCTVRIQNMQLRGFAEGNLWKKLKVVLKLF